MRSDSLPPIVLFLATVAVTAACETTGTLAPGDLTIEVDPSRLPGAAPGLTVVAGTEGGVTVRVTRGGSYQGPVTLGAEGVPVGVRVRSGVLSAVENVGVVWFVADTAAAGSSASVTVTATADGLQGQATAQLALSVAFPPSFSITLGRDTVTLAPEVPDTVDVTITREHGFADAVTFAVAGAPGGLIAAFVQDTVPGDTGLLTLVADSTVARDTTFLLPITASAEGLADRVDTLAVVVSAPAVSGSSRVRLPGG